MELPGGSIFSLSQTVLLIDTLDIPREPLEEEKAICIIGAGPSGLAALKTVLDTPQFKRGIWKPTAYEAREKVGGVWYVYCSDLPEHY